MFELAAPGKTFLLGEYYVTTPGEALVITTVPKFKLIYEPGTFSLKNIHPDSPAGKFITAHFEFFSHYQLTFTDPYATIGGGLGASTAQFLLAYKLIHAEINFNHLINDYINYAWNGFGVIPSGADLLAQANEGISYINKTDLTVTQVHWPFKDLQFHILHTHNKLATHHHLATLENVNSENLHRIFRTAKAAFNTPCEQIFCQTINEYHQELTHLGLVTQTTLELIKQLKNDPSILAIKGCGAMGSDTLLLITKNHQQTYVKNLCYKLNLTYIANNENL